MAGPVTDDIDALRARDDLLTVAGAWGALRARLIPTSSTGEPARTAPGSRPPLNTDVSDLMRLIEDKTRFYGNTLIRETKPRWVPPTSTMPGLLEAVAHRYGHFTHHSSERVAADFLDDAREMRRLVAATLARRQAPKWAGPCPEAGCDGQIYQRAGSVDAVCRECGRVVGAGEWRELMYAAFEDHLLTLSEIVSALVVTGHNVPEKTVRTWSTRGKLPKVYERPDLYRFADAYALAERRTERKPA
jgi:hypothetical protein